MPENTIEPTQKANDFEFEDQVQRFEELRKARTNSTQNGAVNTAEVDLTDSFKEKFLPLQKEGKVEEINKLRAEVQQAVKEGKKVSPELLQQLETSSETPEQKQIKELQVEKNNITNDLKLSEVEKTAAIAELDKKKEKPYWETPEFKGEETSAEKQSENKEEQFKAFEQKSKKYDEIQDDEFIKAYLSAKESGKTPDIFLSEIGKENPAQLTDEQILEKRISRMQLTNDESVEEREMFSAKTPSERKEILNNERKLLAETYKQGFQKYSVSNAAEKEKMYSIARKAVTELSQSIEGLKDKEVWGIVHDSTQLQKISEHARGLMENGLFRKDGSHDVSRIIRLSRLELNAQHMLQKALEQGESNAKAELFKEKHRPSSNNGIAAAPRSESQPSKKDAMLKDRERFLQEELGN